jgi:REP element-mobilizing transposase RayT
MLNDPELSYFSFLSLPDYSILSTFIFFTILNMTTPRSQLISLDVTPYYHCVSRCVRRSFLCGEDKVSGRSYEHRRQWLENRILKLADIYCVDICAYSVMSNHYHLVVHINRPKAESLTSKEVIERWQQEHKLPPLVQQYIKGQLICIDEVKRCEQIIRQWRKRLYSLSWMMKELNFEIALQANREDGCTGHFWESRFKSYALLDEAALLSAMTYTDLNPIRAKIAETPETSQYTSLKKRLESLESNRPTPHGLYPFVGHEHQDKPDGITFRLVDYIEWVDWVGRHIRADKRGHINRRQPAILTRLSLNQTEALQIATNLERRRRIWIGSAESLAFTKQQFNKARIDGLTI